MCSSDLYELQSQRDESGIDGAGSYANSEFSWIVGQTATNALLIDQNPLIFAGVKTQGSTFLLDEMCQAVYDSAAQGISGYWLNTSGSTDLSKAISLWQLVAITSTCTVTSTGTDSGGYYQKIQITNNTQAKLNSAPQLLLHDVQGATVTNTGSNVGTGGGDTYLTANVTSLAVNGQYIFKVYFSTSSPTYTAEVFTNIGT